MAVLTLEQRTGKATRRERGLRRAMLERVDEVNVYAGDILGHVVISKKVARKILKKHGSMVTVREVEELGMMFIEPVPF
jgi:vacuolar-type H+-ATPase catalytic subunit A/Vma1